MGRCSGRCDCHAADWQALDEAAGIKKRKGGRGRVRINADAAEFEQLLAQHYFAEWDATHRDPEHRPSMTDVAEKRFYYSERTLRRNLRRYRTEWPPEEGEPPKRRTRDLVGHAGGRATISGRVTILTRKPSSAA